MGKVNRTERWIITVALTVGVAIVTNLGVIPVQWTDSFEVDQSSSVQGSYQSWTLLNSTIFDLGSTVSGNATFPGFHYSSSVPSPLLYVLSPSQFTTWESTTPLAAPRVATETLQPVIDFQQSILSFKFSFQVKEGGTYYFLMSSTGYTLPTYGTKPSLTYSETTITPPLWYRLVAIFVPVFYVLGAKVLEYRIVRADSLTSAGDKGRFRQMKVQELFEAILGPLSVLEAGIAGGNPAGAWMNFLSSFQLYKDRILGLKPTLDKEAPDISSKLSNLIETLEKETNSTWTIRTFGDRFVSDPALNKLISEIRSEINEWSSDRA